MKITMVNVLSNNYFLLVILLTVRVGVKLHAQVKDASCHYEKLQEYDALEEVKKKRQMEKWMGQ